MCLQTDDALHEVTAPGVPPLLLAPRWSLANLISGKQVPAHSIFKISRSAHFNPSLHVQENQSRGHLRR
jgi:hypothetical protein